MIDRGFPMRGKLPPRIGKRNEAIACDEENEAVSAAHASALRVAIRESDIKERDDMQTNKAFVLRDICGKYILVPFRTNETSEDPILLNGIAATIWECASECRSRNDLLDKIVQMYGIKRNSAEMLAVDSFVAQMERIHLLQEETEEA